MNIASEHLAALQALGYTPDEARFLYIAATHSGYFVPRQFVAFAGVKWGKRSDHFTKKLESRGHASWREYPHLGGVYHLSSKALYRLIDKEGLRNCRRHSTEFIRTRMLLLDFILTNPAHLYLETEPQKTAYFSEQLGVPRDALPAKAYAGSDHAEPAVRYFVNRFPLFLDCSNGSGASPITFSYVDSGEATLAGLVHHLKKYQRLFVHLTDFHFLYIANSPVHFIPAERCFSSFVKGVLEGRASDDLTRYFKLRAAWDEKQYATLSNDDVEWLERANARFRGPDTERRYAAWCSGQLTDDELIRPVSNVQPPRHFRFSPCLVGPGATVPQNTGKGWVKCDSLCHFTGIFTFPFTLVARPTCGQDER